MKRREDDIDELLGKFLAGEADSEETSFVREWMLESEDNRRHYEQLKQIFDRAASIKELRTFDTDAAWNKLRSQLHTGRTRTMLPEHPEKDKSFVWWRVAAAILILSVALIYFLRTGSETPITAEVIASKKALSDTLPDGSGVFLNKETKVQYAYDKQKKLHDVKLVGEAYFNIKNEKQEQFIIDAGDVFIRDIGTSFNVKAYPGSDVVEVLVEEGEIIFYTAENPGIRLKESGKAVYHKKIKQFTIEEPDANITAYKTKFFVFSSTTLGEVAEAVNSVYDKQLIVPENLKSCPITVSFRDESLEDIVGVIAETLDLNFREEQNKIILEGDACE